MAYDVIVLVSLGDITGTWSQVLEAREAKLRRFGSRHFMRMETPRERVVYLKLGFVRIPYKFRRKPVEVLDPRVQFLPGVGAMLVPRELTDGIDPDAETREDWPEDYRVIRGVTLSRDTIGVTPNPNVVNVDRRIIEALWQFGVTGEEVIIGVVDSGCRQGDVRVDYARQFKANGEVENATYVDFHYDAKQYKNDESWYHGTEVCDRLAGELGVVCEAKLAVAASLTKVGKKGRSVGTQDQIAKGIDWLVREPFRGKGEKLGCDVINASLEIEIDEKDQFPVAARQGTMSQILALASRNERLIVCGVGNARGQALGLAAAPSTLAVGAAIPDGAAYEWVDANSRDFALGKPEVLGVGECTSFAAPRVTGAAAMLLQAMPELTAFELKEMLCDLGSIPAVNTPYQLGCGVLDLHRLFAVIKQHYVRL